MKKNNKKSGFTLAEVIVAMGVIGVIAAVMVPTVLSGIQNKQLALMLGKNATSVEAGCLKLVQHATSLSTNDFLGHFNIHKNLDGSTMGSNPLNSISGDNLWNGTEAFFDTRTIDPTEITNYKNAVKNFNGGTASPSVNNLAGSNIVVNTKTGAYWGTSTLDMSEAASDPIVGYIYIDVNGEKSPNRYGRDVFLYGLTDACKMIPAGSNRLYGLNHTIPYESSGCGNNISNGLSCTSRVVRDGYKMNY